MGTTGLDNEEYERQLATCEDSESELTAWEANFIQSIREQLDAGRVLSAKQLDVLDRIWTTLIR